MLPDELALGGSEHSGGFVAPAMTCSCQPVKRRQRVCRTRNMGWKGRSGRGSYRSSEAQFTLR